MNILVFEWMNGGGHWIDGTLPTSQCPFQEQGLLMVQAVCEDIIATGHVPIVPVDSRLVADLHFNCEVKKLAKTLAVGPPVSGARSLDECLPPRLESLDVLLRSWNHPFDSALLIAPESNGCLEELVTVAERLDFSLLGPASNLVALTSDKTRTIDLLRNNGVATAKGSRLDHWLSNEFSSNGSLVLKPNFGSGAEGIQIFGRPAELHRFLDGPNMQGMDTKEWRVEQFLTGRSVSVSVIGHMGQACRVLPPTAQIFDRTDERGVGNYVGAEHPLPQDVSETVQKTAARVAASLPPFRGYLGIDMIYNPEKCLASVVDVNPRLTTSYCWLRQIVDQNIFELILNSASIEQKSP